MSVLREWLSGGRRRASLLVAILVGGAAGATLSMPWVAELGEKQATVRFAVTVEVLGENVPSAVVEDAAARRGFATLDYLRSEEFLQELARATNDRVSLADAEEQVTSTFGQGSILTVQVVAPDRPTLDAMLDTIEGLVIARGLEPLATTSELASTSIGLLSVSSPLEPMLTWPSVIRNSVIGALLGGVIVLAALALRRLRSPLIATQSDLEAVTLAPVLGQLGTSGEHFVDKLRSLSTTLGPVAVIHESPERELSIDEIRETLATAPAAFSRVLIVDARPTRDIPRSGARAGLAEVLAGQASLAEVLRSSGTNVEVLAWGSGGVRDLDFDLAIRKLFSDLRPSYGLVLVLSSPMDGSRGRLPSAIPGDFDLVVLAPGLDRKADLAAMEARLRIQSRVLDGIVLTASGEADQRALTEGFAALRRLPSPGPTVANN